MDTGIGILPEDLRGCLSGDTPVTMEDWTNGPTGIGLSLVKSAADLLDIRSRLNPSREKGQKVCIG